MELIFHYVCICTIFFFFFYIPTAVCPPSSLPCPYLPFAPTFTLTLFLSRKGQASYGYQPNMAYQVAVRPGTLLILRLDKTTQQEGNGAKSRQKSQRQPPAPTVRSPTSYTTVKYMQRTQVSLMQVPSLSAQSLWTPMSPSQLICGFSWGVFDPSGFYSPSFSSSVGFPKLHLMSIAEYHQESLSSSLGYLASESWPCSQYLEWPPSCSMGLKLGQSLVGHSHNVCTTFTPAHLVGRTNCRLKVLWFGWCPSPYTRSLAWLQDMASSGFVSPIAGSPMAQLLKARFTSQNIPHFLNTHPSMDIWADSTSPTKRQRHRASGQCGMGRACSVSGLLKAGTEELSHVRVLEWS